MIYNLPKNFTPNFSHPSTRRRAIAALVYVKSYVKLETTRKISVKTLKKYFGQTQTNTTKWLFNMLLIRSDAYYNADNGIPMTYFQRPGGVLALTKLLAESSNQEVKEIEEITLETAINDFKKKYEVELEQLKNDSLQYKDKSNRLFNPIQNGRKVIKNIVLAELGFVHQYDTECSAPTLLYQYAQQLGLSKKLDSIEAYLSDRTTIRNTIGQETNQDPKIIKIIINSMFAGAKLGCSAYFSLFKFLDYDRFAMEAIQSNPYIISLKDDIKEMWKTIIETTIPRDYKLDKNNRSRKIPITSSQKWKVYFSLERKILDSIRQYSFINNLPSSYLEHDGFSTRFKLNLDSLTKHIHSKTGFYIKLEYEYIGKEDLDGIYESFVSTLYKKTSFDIKPNLVTVSSIIKFNEKVIVILLDNTKNTEYKLKGNTSQNTLYVYSIFHAIILVAISKIEFLDIRQELKEFHSNSTEEDFFLRMIR